MEFLIDGYTIDEELKQLSIHGNKSFVRSLHPGIPNVLGTRIPDLRALAKRIVKSDWKGYLMHANFQYMEERILYGLVLGLIPPDEDVQEYLQRVTRFVHLINSWSVCDTFTFAGGKKYVTKHKPVFWHYLKNWMRQSEAYEIRFGVVMALKYFVDGEYIHELLGELDQIKHEDYYVKMAVAWAISECFVKFPQDTMAYLKNNQLDDFTYNKSLQKICESYRVEVAMKQTIKQMKRKQ